MSDLIAFLTARLDEDEAAARATLRLALPNWQDVHDEVWITPTDDAPETRGPSSLSLAPGVPFSQHIARWDPARVLAEVAAQRAILDRCQVWISYGPVGDREVDRSGDAAFVEAGLAVVRLLAQSHADHPDFDPAWKLGL